MSGIGHLAPGFLVKSVEPKAPLWVYLLAGETNDLLYFGFTATGIEEPSTTRMNFTEGVRYLTHGSIPWSHGFFYVRDLVNDDCRDCLPGLARPPGECPAGGSGFQPLGDGFPNALQPSALF